MDFLEKLAKIEKALDKKEKAVAKEEKKKTKKKKKKEEENVEVLDLNELNS